MGGYHWHGLKNGMTISDHRRGLVIEVWLQAALRMNLRKKVCIYAIRYMYFLALAKLT